MSLIPNPFGRRSGVFDPFSLDLWDHQVHHPFRSLSDLSSRSETESFAHAHIDWKETPTAHVFKADVPGLRKEEVKVEVSLFLFFVFFRSSHSKPVGAASPNSFFSFFSQVSKEDQVSKKKYKFKMYTILIKVYNILEEEPIH
ncbi:18.0 kDa class I heat shock protein-like [Malus sylvestris]|uniref:18.0 kDa class I heat shock protein-like n=1 Tax=Malus sylvestris TaxID=3752 RepID=UPI0021AC1417|nr:18.0 kDa class I heat shock protein-like [Malus sylvestris]